MSRRTDTVFDGIEPPGVVSRGKSPSTELVSAVGSMPSDDSPMADSDSVGGDFARVSAPRGGAGAAPPIGEPLGSPSSLDTLGITRPAGHGSVSKAPCRVVHRPSRDTLTGGKGGEAEICDPSRENRHARALERPRRGYDPKWIDELGPPTAAHREELARRHESKALRIKHRSRLEGESEVVVSDKTKWHRDRAKAQRWRISRVLDCGAEELAITCPCCGVVSEMSLGCGARLYCFQCRDAYASRRRGQFLAAREDVLNEARAAGLLEVTRRGRRYSEKFLTLTVPHLLNDTIQDRIGRLLGTWKPFLKKLNRHWNALGARRVDWFRVIEWTEGSDGRGHPHFHLWMFSPFIDVEVVRQTWREALVLGGCPAEQCESPIVHIKEVRDGRGGVKELIKYLTKDITSGGKKIPAEVYAEVIKALEGSRATQGSRGFIGRSKKADPACKDCGSTLPKDVRKKPKASEKSERVEA